MVRTTYAEVAAPFPPFALRTLRTGTRFPVRLKVAALAGAAVIVTLSILLMPTYGRVRSALARAQGERLAAIANSAAAQLPRPSPPPSRPRRATAS